MSRWYRAYEGTVTDAKLGEAALIAEVSRSVAIAAWHCILESAACKNNSGSFETTPRRVAVILCEPPARIAALFGAFTELGLLDDHGVASWKRRQYESDSSTERARKCRERQRNGDAALQQQDVTPPETEAETEEPPVAPRKRGASPAIGFPSDWEMPPPASLTPKARACAEQWTRASYETAHEAFCLHWRNSRKRRPDWLGTWCVWVIREHSKVMRDQKFGNAPIDRTRAAPPTRAECLERVEFFAKIGKQDEAEEWRRRAYANDRAAA